ncbi:MAG: Rieske (2Fe-2S) protein [Nocardioides sp.]|uniref:Rieske (2Fe-2S) protein n=1 Tax=Nocardioides sp. TaxID=35761 RepID=UPI003F07634D
MTLGVGRRRVVLGAAGVAAVPALAACGEESTPKQGGTTTPTTTSPGTPGSTGGGGEAVASTADVPVGGGVIDANRQMVITQPVEGEFKAFSSICTHQGCPVGEIRGDEIVCPCHFSKFSIADGSVISGQATAPLPSIAVKVEGDEIVLG